jgi:hypothetical protein
MYSAYLQGCLCGHELILEVLDLLLLTTVLPLHLYNGRLPSPKLGELLTHSCL